MTRYQRDKLKVWCVVVRKRGEKYWWPAWPVSVESFRTRKQCQVYIDDFRAGTTMYDGMEHRPMMFLPAKERTR